MLSKMMERIVYEQIKKYMSVNKLVTNFQHAYREGHATATALTQMTDDWLREIHEKTLSWSKYINKITAKMGSVISVIKRCATFLTPKATKQVTQALILSNLDYCPSDGLMPKQPC